MKISVKVIPYSKIEEVTQDKEGYLVKVKDPAQEGKANKSVIRLLAKFFKVPSNSVRIKSGLASRNKIIEIL